jgi:hypothetical protein
MGQKGFTEPEGLFVKVADFLGEVGAAVGTGE